MEPVNASCEIWREALGAYAFGEFDDDANALSVHLEWCRDCQELARELKETVELLGFVDPSSVDDIRTVPVLAQCSCAGRASASGNATTAAGAERASAWASRAGACGCAVVLVSCSR